MLDRAITLADIRKLAARNGLTAQLDRVAQAEGAQVSRVIRKNLGPFMAILVLIVHRRRSSAATSSTTSACASRSPRRSRCASTSSSTTRRPSRPARARPCRSPACEIGDIAERDAARTAARSSGWTSSRSTPTSSAATRAPQLRPRTGLKDMYVQIFPGKDGDAGARRASRSRSPASLTDVDLDEILSELDARTRDYVTLLANGAGEGLRGTRRRPRADASSATGRRCATSARVNHAVAKERIALRRLVTSLAQINGELARKPRGPLAPRLHGASTTLDAFASEDDNLRDAVGELAPTLQTGDGDAATPSRRSPTSSGRRRARCCRRCASSRTSTPRSARSRARRRRSCATKIRPFVRRAVPLARDLAPAARGLARTFPELDRNAKVLNDFANMLGHNPRRPRGARQGRPRRGLPLLARPGSRTRRRNLQSIDDANGPMRPIFLTGTCTTLTSLVNDLPQARVRARAVAAAGDRLQEPRRRRSLSVTKSLRGAARSGG